MIISDNFNGTMIYQTGMRNVGPVVEGGISLSTIATFADARGNRICAAYEVALSEHADFAGLSNPRERSVSVGMRGARASWTEYDCDEALERLVTERLAK